VSSAAAANRRDVLPDGARAWLRDAERIDLALYAAIAATPTLVLDRGMNRVTRAADHSRLWLTAAAVLAVGRGPQGRRAARLGVASVAATSAIVNAVLKPLGRRPRPDPIAERVPLARQVSMPRSTSFPSGHAASAFAFATSVGRVLPREAMVLQAFAAVVAYSRVHTGVHYPGDVVAGSLIGAAIAQVTSQQLERRFAA
jgi:membrane-associated phospholipid phosphatase